MFLFEIFREKLARGRLIIDPLAYALHLTVVFTKTRSGTGFVRDLCFLRPSGF